MPLFFQSWRRKLGCVTLAMACVLMIAWVRSLSAVDQVPFKDFAGDSNFVGSQSGTFYWIRIVPNQSPTPASAPAPDSNSESLFRRMGFSEIEIQQNSGGMLVAAGKGTGIPYWLVTIPLALLSAWLLLSKPNAKTVDLQSSQFVAE